MNTLTVLSQEILKSHHTSAHHLSSVPLRLVLVDERIWEGVVEIFWLTNHPEAKTAYAWTENARNAGEAARHIVMLHLPPIDSPQTAVHHAMMN